MWLLSDVKSLLLEQPASPVMETSWSASMRRCVYATMLLVTAGAISHIYTSHITAAPHSARRTQLPHHHHSADRRAVLSSAPPSCRACPAHYLDAAWDVGSVVLGVLSLRRVVREGQRGLSLRYVVWYTALTVFNALLYVAAWLYQRFNGYPPPLPANPATPWSQLTVQQQNTALLTYQLEQLPYIAMAVALMSNHNCNIRPHNTTTPLQQPHQQQSRVALLTVGVLCCAVLRCVRLLYRELKSRTYRPPGAATNPTTAAATTVGAVGLHTPIINN